MVVSVDSEEYYKMLSEIERLRKELKETLITLKHARVFIDSRLKMHKDGVLLYDEWLDRLQLALKEE